MTKTIYFPACGFGFWYLLGKYTHIHNDPTVRTLIGSSAGSLICFCSLLDRKYPLYETVEQCAVEVLDTYKRTHCIFNLYTISWLFVHKLRAYIDETMVEERLKRIQIQMTEVHIHGYKYSRRRITPISVEQLCELCLASCYIPLMSRHTNCLYYMIDGRRYIDGAFSDAVLPIGYPTVHTMKYAAVVIPDKTKIKKMYDDGVAELFKPTDDSTFTILHLWILFPNIVILFIQIYIKFGL
jgi:predicted patatin/cPLA2 family phospholipase